MSTEYYLVCDSCKVRLEVADAGWNVEFNFMSGEPDCMRALGEFLRDHTSSPGYPGEKPHALRVLADHTMDVMQDTGEMEPYTTIEWTDSRHLSQI